MNHIAITIQTVIIWKFTTFRKARIRFRQLNDTERWTYYTFTVFIDNDALKNCSLSHLNPPVSICVVLHECVGHRLKHKRNIISYPHPYWTACIACNDSASYGSACLKILDDDWLLFKTEDEGEKLFIIKFDPSISIAVVLHKWIRHWLKYNR